MYVNVILMFQMKKQKCKKIKQLAQGQSCRDWSLAVWRSGSLDHVSSQQSILNFGVAHSTTLRSAPSFAVAGQNSASCYPSWRHQDPNSRHTFPHPHTHPQVFSQYFENYNIWEFRFNNGVYPHNTSQVRWKTCWICSNFSKKKT